MLKVVSVEVWDEAQAQAQASVQAQAQVGVVVVAENNIDFSKA